MDEAGKINSEWMTRVKEVVNWTVEEKMFCILNVYDDGWLLEELSVKNKYINLWSQISREFKDYDEYLIFESINNIVIYNNNYDIDYISLNNLNQEFVDIIRKSGGKNLERLLIISGIMSDLDLTYSSEYKIPIDPSNNLAISINYYSPYDFTSTYDNDVIWYDDNGMESYYSSPKKWGSTSEYNELIGNLEMMKKYFVDKGVPVILAEVGVLTEEKKKIESIREYLYSIFSISIDYDGIMACLWDTSSKIEGNMNFYDRENNQWYDEKIKDNFKIISKRKYVKPTDYLIMTNILSNDDLIDNGFISLRIGEKKPKKIIFNVNINKINFSDVQFKLFSFNIENEIIINRKYSKKEYDGTYTFTVDVSDKNLNEYIEIDKSSENANSISFNYLTVEFQEEFLSIDKNSYKSDILNYIL